MTAFYRDGGGRNRGLAKFGEQTQLTLVRCDVTDEASVRDFASGPSVHETPPEDLDRMLKLFLIPFILLARAAVSRLLENGGLFIAIASSSVRRPFAGGAGNLVSKAALITLIESLDVEYGDEGLRDNVLLPGALNTPANRSAMADTKNDSWVRPEHSVMKCRCCSRQTPSRSEVLSSR